MCGFLLDSFEVSKRDGRKSHIIALNLHGQVVIIELPAGDPTKAHVYLGPSVTDDRLPVTLSFADVDHDGRPDLVIHVGETNMVLFNNGHDDQFHAPSQP